VNAAPRIPIVLLAREPEDTYASHAPPQAALEPYTPGEIHERIRGGELDADVLEELLTFAARGRTLRLRGRLRRPLRSG
jgi:hypothetical protein